MVYIQRGEWEQPGLEVAAHTGSPPVDWSLVNNITIHYPGGGARPDNPDEVWAKSYVAAMQNDYVNNRSGYSIGYNEVVTKNGIVVQARGAEYACAANGYWSINRDSYAIQIAVSGANDDAEAAPPAAVAAVRERVAWAQQLAGKKLETTGHRDHNATSCPGGGIYEQVWSGVFDVPYPPTTTPPQEDHMGMNVTKIRFSGFEEQLVCFRASADTLDTAGILADPVVVLADPTPAQRSAIEAGLGRPLTRLN